MWPAKHANIHISIDLSLHAHSWMFIYAYTYILIYTWICHLCYLCVCEDTCEDKRIQTGEYIDINLMSPLSPII